MGIKINSVEEILVNLINGLDPRTGAPINEDSPLREESVVAALNSTLSAVRIYRSDQVRKLSLPANTGKPWKKEEDDKLISDFEHNLSIEILAKSFERTAGAIRARLILLGKIEENGL